MSGTALARAAEGLAGARFRLHGRDPATGLDCIGVLSAALAAIGQSAALPSHYRLRMRDVAALLPDPASCGFALADGSIRPGDVVLLALEGAQHHLLIAAGECRFVHAHAGLGRVVVGAAPAGRVLGHWRLLPKE